MLDKIMIAAALLAGLAAVPAAQAQYKIIGKDGRVTYSDRPPVDDVKSVEQRPYSSGPLDVGLPSALQQAVTRNPVTLYTTDPCEPCNSARTYLRARGVPFTERTVKTDEDIILFRRISPQGTIPVVTIGTNQLLGYEAGALATALTNAGYPAEARLPDGFKTGAIAGLAPPVPLAAPETPAGPPPIPLTPPPPAEGPAGFRF